MRIMRSYWNSLRISCNYIGDYAIGIYYVHSVHTYTRARAPRTDFFSPINQHATRDRSISIMQKQLHSRTYKECNY